jgi:hypothetical protein
MHTLTRGLVDLSNTYNELSNVGVRGFVSSEHFIFSRFQQHALSAFK